mmetsp:Transcript_26529/g.84319  ORF Transcript_26529/g.84319 Transcript_26529/m.84319 type:complete len:412 (-) Transcript_26529:173-1408(-)
MRCSSRAISEYFSSTYSRLASGAAARSQEQRSVRNASTVCMPLTSENFRSDKYSASDWESGTVATAEQKGEKSPMPGASGTMEPRHGSASTAIASGRTSLPVQTRSTMQSTTLTRPSSASPSRTTASWSFSHAKSSGGTSPSSATGSWLSSGFNTLAIAAPSEQESEVALCTIGSSSSVESPNTSACGGKKSGVPSAAAIASNRWATTSPLTLMSTSSAPVPLDARWKSSCHFRFGRCTTANGMPDAEIAGTTSPIPNRPAPKCTWYRPEERPPSPSAADSGSEEEEAGEAEVEEEEAAASEAVAAAAAALAAACSRACGPRARASTDSCKSQTSSSTHWRTCQSARVKNLPAGAPLTLAGAVKKSSAEAGSSSTLSAATGPSTSSRPSSSTTWHSSISPLSPRRHSSKRR